MHLRPLFATLAFATLVAQSLPARADAWRPPFADPYAYFTEDAQYEAWYALPRARSAVSIVVVRRRPARAFPMSAYANLARNATAICRV